MQINVSSHSSMVSHHHPIHFLLKVSTVFFSKWPTYFDLTTSQMLILRQNLRYRHSVHWVSTPPQKHHHLFLAKPPSPPLKSENCPSPPFLGNTPSILVFREPSTPIKVGFFSEPPKYQSFSSLTHLIF